MNAVAGRRPGSERGVPDELGQAVVEDPVVSPPDGRSGEDRCRTQQGIDRHEARHEAGPTRAFAVALDREAGGPLDVTGDDGLRGSPGLDLDEMHGEPDHIGQRWRHLALPACSGDETTVMVEASQPRPPGAEVVGRIDL